MEEKRGGSNGRHGPRRHNGQGSRPGRGGHGNSRHEGSSSHEGRRRGGSAYGSDRRGQSNRARRFDDSRPSPRSGRREEFRDAPAVRDDVARAQGYRSRPGQDSERRRRQEPMLPDDITSADLPTEIRRDLGSLSRDNSEIVARHLVAAFAYGEEDPERGLEHARAARHRAARVGVVRETCGVLAYRCGEWSEALSELRAARRISGGPGLLAMMADCERGLGRPERALDLGRSDDARALGPVESEELRIVLAGARMDLGRMDEAVVSLQTGNSLSLERDDEEAPRYFYAYAEALLAAGRRNEAAEWFRRASELDTEELTDAAERAAALGSDGGRDGSHSSEVAR